MVDPKLSQPPKASETPFKLLRGCAYTLAASVMAGGILVIGGFDAAAWGSALIALIIGWLVVKVSGSNGSWE
jgi:hypothetical protein